MVSRWVRAINPWHRPLKAVLRFLFWLLLRIEVEGKEKVPQTGPLIVYFNHANWLDPVIVAGVIDRELFVMGKEELFRHRLPGAILRAYGVFPVRRQQVDVQAFRRALQLLERGAVVIIAPEGTRSHTGVLQPAKTGVVRLALRSGALLQPAAVTGCLSFEANLRQLRRTRVRVRFGEPFALSSHERATSSKEELQRLSDEIMAKLAALLPPEMRGVYAQVGDQLKPTSAAAEEAGLPEKRVASR